MTAKIRGIDFGPVCGASGVQGFFGDPDFPEYKHQRLFKFFPGYSFEGMSFTSKTTTMMERKGNMPLCNDGIRVQDLRPKCIIAKFWKGVALNAVGLSGPGVLRLLDKELWQKRTKPWRLSFMPVWESVERRLRETDYFVGALKSHLCVFRTQDVMIQLNITCPNVGLKQDEAQEKIKEVRKHISILTELKLPVEVKFSVTIDPSVASEIASHEVCDSVCISNTIPWGQLPHEVNWKKLFGTDESPLKQFGGGGLSGWPLLRPTARWIKQLRQLGYRKHINAGGGIMHPRDVHVLKDAGADSVFIGSVAMLRPWRVKSIINEALVAFAHYGEKTVHCV